MSFPGSSTTRSSNPFAGPTAPRQPAPTGYFPVHPAPGLLGPRPAGHQAFLGAPYQPYGASLAPPPLDGYGVPAQAPPYGGQPSPPVPAPWDPTLPAALHSAPSPSPSLYEGGGVWYMDSGATAHMTAHPGNLSSSTPVNTPTRITVGNGSSLPITITMSNVLVSPDLVTSLVFVRRVTRENPLTVEFDGVGFSVKDARTRMVLHRCDSPDELYPMHAGTSTSTPVALAARVELWHARLGHPNPTVLRQILRSFSFSCNKLDEHTCEACRLGKHVRLPLVRLLQFPFFHFSCFIAMFGRLPLRVTWAIYTTW